MNLAVRGTLEDPQHYPIVDQCYHYDEGTNAYLPVDTCSGADCYLYEVFCQDDRYAYELPTCNSCVAGTCPVQTPASSAPGDYEDPIDDPESPPQQCTVDAQAWIPTISDDGRYVAYVRTNYYQGKAYLLDRVTGVSTPVNGSPADFSTSHERSVNISGGGNVLSYSVGGTDASSGIFRFDRASGQRTRLVGKASVTGQRDLALSDDGSRIVYAYNTCILLYDHATDSTRALSGISSASCLTEDVRNPNYNAAPLSAERYYNIELHISGNGRYVAFIPGTTSGYGAANTLYVVDLQTNTIRLAAAMNGIEPIFITDDGRYLFYAQMQDEGGNRGFVQDQTTGQVTLVDIAAARAQLPHPFTGNYGMPYGISDDGKTLTFIDLGHTVYYPYTYDLRTGTATAAPSAEAAMLFASVAISRNTRTYAYVCGTTQKFEMCVREWANATATMVQDAECPAS